MADRFSEGGGNHKPQSTTQNGSRRKLLLGAGLSLAAAGTGAGAYWLGKTPVNFIDGVPRARLVEGDSVLPAEVDVLVVGGGFVGTMTALTLAERGVAVALCEKGVIAGEASGRSMGYVTSQFADPTKLALLARSKVLWKDMNSRTAQETGYRLTGLVMALHTAEERDGAEGWLSAVRGMEGAEGNIVSGAEIQRLFPGMSSIPLAALNSMGDGSVEPVLAAPAIAEAARRKGAVILQNCAVRGIETSGGRVSAVVTEKGTIRCKTVVIAGGAWSPLLAGSLGLSIPQFDMSMTMMGLSPVAGPETSLSMGGYGIRQQLDGGYSFGLIDLAVPIVPRAVANVRKLWPALKAYWPVSNLGFSPSEFWHELVRPHNWALDKPSPFEERRILTRALRPEPTLSALALLGEDYPAFKAAKVRETWSGILSTTLDNVPVISEVAQYPGLLIGTGLIEGLTLGPAAGEALADLAMGMNPKVPLHDYRFSRFSDGSPLVFSGPSSG